MFGHLSYLISIILFAGAAVLIEWLFEFNLLRRYYKTILLGIGISVLLVPAEYVALSVKAWKYSPIHTVAKLFLGAEVETYLYMFFVALAIVGAVIAWTDFEDKGKNIFRESFRILSNDFRKFLRKWPQN